MKKYLTKIWSVVKDVLVEYFHPLLWFLRKK